MVSKGKKGKDIPRAQTTVHHHLAPCNGRCHIHGGCIHVVSYIGESDGLFFLHSLTATWQRGHLFVVLVVLAIYSL